MNNETLILGGAGYIGSALSSVIDCDILDKKNYQDYDLLKRVELVPVHNYKNIIYLAGLSSVSVCKDSSKTVISNILDFANILNQIVPEQKFIYASTASIYGNFTDVNRFGKESDPINHALNNYDMSMFARESIARLTSKNTYGLRFGTVAGCLPNQTVIRDNTVVNAMVKNALIYDELILSNKHTNRSFLGINDLCEFIKLIIDDQIPSDIYNLSSFDNNILEVCDFVAQKFNLDSSKIKEVEGYNPYNFKMDNSKMKQYYIPQDTLETTVESLNKNRRNLIYTKWTQYGYEL